MPKKVLRKILIPTDFSKLSLESIEYTLAIFEPEDLQIYLLHAIDKAKIKKTKTKNKDADKLLGEIKKEAIKKLDNIADDYLENVYNVETVVRVGEPYSEIVKYAQQKNVDLIVISTHGRTGISHMLMGSVAEKVVRYSPTPVLTVKPEKLQLILMEQEDVDEQLHIKLKLNEK